MPKSWRRLVFVFLAIPLLLFGVNAAPASAQVTGFGTTNDFYGWNYYHTDCGTSNVYDDFYYQGFRATPSTIQFRWESEYTGNMKITISAPGNENHTYYNLAAWQVYWVNWTASLNYYFWLTWMPDGGGGCSVYFPVG